MSISFPCPNPECGKPVDVAETDLWAEVRCPYCGAIFAAAEQSPGTSTDDIDPYQTKAPESPLSTDDPDSYQTRAQPDADGVTEEMFSAALADGKAPTDLPKRIGRFEVQSCLGEGAFGRVYRARDPQLDRAVALKVAKPSALATKMHVERFLREARATANLRHPHIVPVFDAGCDEGLHYIASAFIRGRTLADTIETERPDFQRTAQIVRQLAEALGYAHGQGIVHRDVKPANVMIDGERGGVSPPVPLLMDFGLAARSEEAEKITHEGAILGTPAYMAPEQAAGQHGRPLPASDQYSLGIMLYELLCGQRPFAGSMEVVITCHLKEEPPAPHTINAKVPRDLETICLKCLAKAPEKRYPDCLALADDLRRWLEGEPIQARRMSLTERFVRWVKKNPALVGGMAAGAGIFLTLVMFLLGMARQQEHQNQVIEMAVYQLGNETDILANHLMADLREQRLNAWAVTQKHGTKAAPWKVFNALELTRNLDPEYAEQSLQELDRAFRGLMGSSPSYVRVQFLIRSDRDDREILRVERDTAGELRALKFIDKPNVSPRPADQTKDAFGLPLKLPRIGIKGAVGQIAQDGRTFSVLYAGLGVFRNPDEGLVPGETFGVVILSMDLGTRLNQGQNLDFLTDSDGKLFLFPHDVGFLPPETGNWQDAIKVGEDKQSRESLPMPELKERNSIVRRPSLRHGSFTPPRTFWLARGDLVPDSNALEPLARPISSWAAWRQKKLQGGQPLRISPAPHLGKAVLIAGENKHAVTQAASDVNHGSQENVHWQDAIECKQFAFSFAQIPYDSLAKPEERQFFNLIRSQPYEAVVKGAASDIESTVSPHFLIGVMIGGIGALLLLKRWLRQTASQT